MRKMKDSGIEWVGEIPQNWKLEKVKYHFNTYKVIPGILSQKYDRLALTLKGVIHRSKDDSDGLQPKDFYTYQLLRENDLVFKLIDLQNVSTSRVGLAHDTGLVSPAYIILHAKDVLPEYAEKFFLMMWYREIFNALGDAGVRSSLNAADLLNVPFPVPELVEQKRIATFLESKCAEIDALTTDIQAQIDTLEQYKRSVITEAVTKGLDPDAEMKDSGIEWCPQIPAHWEYCNPKGLFALRNDRAFPSDRQLTASQEYGIVFQDEYMEMTGNKVVTVEKDFSILKHVEPDDFVISMRSFQGGLEYSDKEGCISSAYVMLIPKKKYVYAPFYRWFFKSSKYINALQSTSNLVRDGQAMRYSNFVKVPLFIIPLDEQKQIADYLNKQVGSIDSILKGKKEQLSVLADYKKSLIYEYVTGKKEVPQAVSDQAPVLDSQVILMGILINKLGNDIRGKVQIQKMLYLTNEYIGLNRGVQYYRYDHGPYDLQLEQYVDVLVSNHWYEEKHQRADLLIAGKNHNDFVEKYGDQFSDKQTEIDNLIDILRPMKTSQVERIATLFAAWNDFIIDGNPTPTDSQIIHEVMNNWTDNKANTQYTTWQGTLKKMKQHGIVPQGLGLHTLPKV